jgi:hypothetical protein
MKKHVCGRLGETSGACSECDVIRSGETNNARRYAAQWIRNLVAAGHVAAGEVERRATWRSR